MSCPCARVPEDENRALVDFLRIDQRAVLQPVEYPALVLGRYRIMAIQEMTRRSQAAGYHRVWNTVVWETKNKYPITCRIACSCASLSGSLLCTSCHGCLAWNWSPSQKYMQRRAEHDRDMYSSIVAAIALMQEMNVMNNTCGTRIPFIPSLHTSLILVKLNHQCSMGYMS